MKSALTVGEMKKRRKLGRDIRKQIDRDFEKRKAPRKYKHVRCDKCNTVGSAIPKGRVFGNHGKKQFECGSCGHYWQYGS